MSAHSQRVRELFNEKAERWSTKYRPGGPLEERLHLFGRALRAYATKGARVLDFGCGAGDLARRLASRGYSVCACDVSSAMISAARSQDDRSQVDWRVLDEADGRQLPFQSSEFDAVVASSVFEYVDRVDLVLGEIARVTKPSGVVVVTVPNPSHPLRKLEKAVRTGVATFHFEWLAGRPSALGRYVRYLQLSKNRPALSTWVRDFATSGFERLPLDQGNAPLAVLGFRKRVQ